MATDPVKKILSHQNRDGSFLTPKLARKSPTITAKIGYQPKYKGTIWQAIFLAQLGAEPNDSRIKKLGEYILNTNYFEELEVFGLNFTRGDRRITTIPCYVANMIWALSKLGFYSDYRIKNSIDWMVHYQRFDDGDFKTPEKWPYRGRKDRCFGKHSCYKGCTQALKAMTVIPEQDRTEEINNFIKHGIEYILLHKIYKRSHNPRLPIKVDYNYLTFPLKYYDDVLEILNTLSYFKIRNDAIDATIQFILAKRQTSGKWLLESTIRPETMHAPFEKKGTESKWITYRAINVLKQYYENKKREKT